MKVELLSFVLVIVGVVDLRVAGQSESPVVNLRAGQLRGTTADTHSRTIYAFRGIPYAKPPVGKRRLKDPEYLKHWMGVWNATRAPPHCLQYNRLPHSAVQGDEDCLYLSVFTPSLTPTPSPLPVIFYIHGGAFMYGGSKIIAPTTLLENDVVLVTANYRLGPLGFLTTGDDAMPGNFGLKDQAMALRWVHDNIAAFGGDPSRVTLAGNSAGGASVHFHYLSPLSKGLFVRGISMSGCTLNPWVITEKATEKTTRLAALLGCPTSNTRDLTTCLRHRPARDIVEQVPAFQGWKELPFAPFGAVVEPPGLNRFLEKSPIDYIANGEVQDLPWMTGFTTHEGIYPTSEIVGEPESLKYLQENWEQLGPLLLDFNDTAANLSEVSQQALKQYLADANIHESIPQLIELVGDRIFKAGIIEAVRLMSSKNTAKVHLYQYEHRAERSYTEFYTGDKTDYGVSHADDVLLLLFNEAELKSLSEQDKAMSRTLAKMWEKYAVNGQPHACRKCCLLTRDRCINDCCLVAALENLLDFGGNLLCSMATWTDYTPHRTVDWSPVDAKPGFLTLARLKQNAEMEETHVKEAGNVEYWKSLPIEENILTPAQAHTEL